MIDPHAKVTSVAQDNWVQLAELFYANCLRLAMKPDQTSEAILAAICVADQARQFHILALSFDGDVKATCERHQKAQESQP